MRNATLLLLALTVACTPKPPTDKKVVRMFQGTKQETQYVYGGKESGYIKATVPALFLVADDASVCEVDSHEYARAQVGRLASCQWEDNAP